MSPVAPRAHRLALDGRPVRVLVDDDHLVLGDRRWPLPGLDVGEVESAGRDLRLLVLGVSLWLVGGLLTGLLWSQGWASRFVAGAVPWTGVVLALLGLVRAARPRARLVVAGQVLEGPARRVQRLAGALRRTKRL